MIDFKAFRKANWKTQKLAAEYFDCDQSFISQMETGKSNIPPGFMSKILEDNRLDKSMLPAPAALKPYSLNHDKIGVPYYDVDFIGGFDLVENDQTIDPAYYIDFTQYNRADCWVNITGHSMEPMINQGDMIALKRVRDWKNYLLYGEVYAVVTDEYRTVKIIRKSPKGDDFIRFVPYNREEYDEQDVPISVIRRVFRVLGCAKLMY